MIEQQSNHETRALAALALCAFAIGTAELVIVGVLNLIAHSMQVSVSTAGQLVTGYALGIAIGGPILTVLTMRLERRTLLLVGLIAYILSTILAVTATSFTMLLVARILSGAVHGMLIGVASVLAASLVPPKRRGQAIGMVFGGIALSTVLGVPLGTLVGQQWGWHATFIGIIGLGVLALIGASFSIPARKHTSPDEPQRQHGHALSLQVLAVLGIGFLLMGGQFTIFTYLALFLQQVTHVQGSLISALLFVYGGAAAIGTFAGGRFADKSASRTLLLANAVLIPAIMLLYLAGSILIFVVLGLMFWGLAGFGLIPSFQFRVISLAGRSKDLAATLGASVVNAGIAAGALVGGRVLDSHTVHNIIIVGLIPIIVVLPITWATQKFEVPMTETVQ